VTLYRRFLQRITVNALVDALLSWETRKYWLRTSWFHVKISWWRHLKKFVHPLDKICRPYRYTYFPLRTIGWKNFIVSITVFVVEDVHYCLKKSINWLVMAVSGQFTICSLQPIFRQFSEFFHSWIQFFYLESIDSRFPNYVQPDLYGMILLTCLNEMWRQIRQYDDNNRSSRVI